MRAEVKGRRANRGFRDLAIGRRKCETEVRDRAKRWRHNREGVNLVLTSGLRGRFGQRRWLLATRWRFFALAPAMLMIVVLGLMIVLLGMRGILRRVHRHRASVARVDQPTNEEHQRREQGDDRPTHH